jgi:hypothetical protein
VLSIAAAGAATDAEVVDVIFKKPTNENFVLVAGSQNFDNFIPTFLRPFLVARLPSSLSRPIEHAHNLQLIAVCEPACYFAWSKVWSDVHGSSWSLRSNSGKQA